MHKCAVAKQIQDFLFACLHKNIFAVDEGKQKPAAAQPPTNELCDVNVNQFKYQSTNFFSFLCLVISVRRVVCNLYTFS